MKSVEYRNIILGNASHVPKTIVELMNGCGCWVSTDACAACDLLVSQGILALHHTTGPLYQHKHFILDPR
jgi:hypothetical protein